METIMDFARLKALSIEYSKEKLNKDSRLPGLIILDRSAPSNLEASIYMPVICLILQGSKTVSIGDQSVDVGPGHALLVSHDLPVVSRITRATAVEPYVAVILTLDLQVVHSLANDVSIAPSVNARSLSAGPAEQSWVAPLIRYIELMHNPMDAKILGPSIFREIHYRLMLAPIGAGLRNLLIADGHANRVAKAISQLRSAYRDAIKVPDLARVAGMSESSFHEHFKSVTGTTPLQYQKDLRLIEARTLLTAQNKTVAEAAYAVGYESPTQFSRDYSRKFGLPPSRHGNSSRLSATAH
jgi:AraC-like DNA-binding protein